MRLYATRLHEGDLLKESIEKFVRENRLSAATIISAVGSLNTAVIRMAGAEPSKQDIRTLKGPFEIVSLIGNLGPERTHLHISVSDNNGAVIGGHLKEDSVVHTTVELVVAAEETLQFSEELDADTGFGELKVEGTLR